MILVVEDDDDIRRNLHEALVAENYEVECVANGREALARLEQEPRPHLLLLDLMMPEMTGWELLEEVRQRPRLAGMRVVVATVMASQAGGLEGIAGFLKKPFDLSELYAIVKTNLPPGTT